MTPSKERQIISDLRAVIAANDELDKKQSEAIAALDKKVKALSDVVDSILSSQKAKSAFKK